MKNIYLGIFAAIVVGLVTFFAPANASAQSFDSRQNFETTQHNQSSHTLDQSYTVPTPGTIMADTFINSVVEVQLTNGKKARGKVMQFNKDFILLEDVLITKKFPTSELVTIKFIKTRMEVFQEGSKKVFDQTIKVGQYVVIGAAIPVIVPAELFAHGVLNTCIFD
jgi:hypothetical protein